MTRRDLCHVVGRRARRLTDAQAVHAWRALSTHLEDELSMTDVPKFRQLLRAIRAATIAGAVSCILFAATLHGAILNFHWRANTETNVVGYRLYQGSAPGLYMNVAVINGRSITNWGGDVGAAQYFALTAINSAGLESAPTRELVYVPPAAPTLPNGFDGEALWLITDSSCDFVIWEPAITNEVPSFWPLEIFRSRIVRVPLK